MRQVILSDETAAPSPSIATPCLLQLLGHRKEFIFIFFISC